MTRCGGQETKDGSESYLIEPWWLFVGPQDSPWTWNEKFPFSVEVVFFDESNILTTLISFLSVLGSRSSQARTFQFSGQRIPFRPKMTKTFTIVWKSDYFWEIVGQLFHKIGFNKNQSQRFLCFIDSCVLRRCISAHFAKLLDFSCNFCVCKER